MLYMLGPIALTVWPYNTHEVERSAATDYVEKDVMGRRRPLEYVGEGTETVKLKVKILPQKFVGGLAVHELLDQLREGGEPQFLLRGDGKPLGWFVITDVSETHTMLDKSGVGKVVDVEISLKRDDTPQAGSAFSSLVSVFA